MRDLEELDMLNQLVELGSKAAHAHAQSNSDDGHKGTAAFVKWQELRAEMGALIRAAYAPKVERQPAPELDDNECRCEPSDYLRPSDYDGDGSVSAMARRAVRSTAESVHRDGLPTIKGASISGRYVVVTPAGWGDDKAALLRDAILRTFPVNPAFSPKPGNAAPATKGGA